MCWPTDNTAWEYDLVFPSESLECDMAFSSESLERDLGFPPESLELCTEEGNPGGGGDDEDREFSDNPNL